MGYIMINRSLKSFKRAASGKTQKHISTFELIVQLICWRTADKMSNADEKITFNDSNLTRRTTFHNFRGDIVIRASYKLVCSVDFTLLSNLKASPQINTPPPLPMAKTSWNGMRTAGDHFFSFLTFHHCCVKYLLNGKRIRQPSPRDFKRSYYKSRSA